MREINLKEAKEFIDDYIDLRNSYADVLLTQPVWRKQTESWLKHNHEVEIRGLVDDNGSLLGIIILYLFRAGEIAICVREKHQGIGTSLLAIIERIAGEHYLDSVWAWVLNENTSARRFFEKNGFEKEANSMRNYNNKMWEGIKYRKKFAPVRSPAVPQEDEESDEEPS